MIKIVEVGPRDGLQNEKKNIPTETKIQFIDMLVAAGHQTIEVTSFVSPKWVPQMADHQTVAEHFAKQDSACEFMALTPNLKGLENAHQAGIKQIAVFTSASETFTQKNINCSISQSLDNFQQLIRQAHQYGMRVRGYISCALGCPYEGYTSEKSVLDIAVALFKAGCYEVSIGDTIGVGTPSKARALIKQLQNNIPSEKLAVHFHDTYGQALANILACLEENITVIDSSVSGLGGCPYAKGASGNVATEEVLYMLQGLGLSTPVDLNKTIMAGDFICKTLDIPNRSKVANAILAKA